MSLNVRVAVGRCWCEKHSAWFHGDVKDCDLRVARNKEIQYCESDTRHRGRKRKICLACRDRIETETKLKKLEVEGAEPDILAFSEESLVDSSATNDVEHVFSRLCTSSESQASQSEPFAPESEVSLISFSS